ncbi:MULTISPECIES: DUF2934 domain-containing protein [Pseudomonas]|uniref:DUF2934 domain-containing protein n=1 Tax=Pseudomonas TaxID=286 RepID=UPI001C8035DC|nr:MULTISPECIES: DUF2934 domain-containing protein [Pseudomonas]MDG9927527.1 DUF2934 domain-containing protein [Pseudomonas sp. GD04042]MDH0484456.1 DUF2934 domain-containing protein [Pseudomonas sp. GD04015]MDH0602948.1 DUF2934 domain-containing protein [Pseudomonas sp. GD03869]MDH0897434.1 DUF2934 domain-containing protein [Pseudomonas sp. GD03875]MDH1064938.1 DUF2934 domain-containing protein [Pseudomonas sp. GD03985]
MSIDEQRVREFAYQIWESEGKPAGQEERHWAMARKLAEAEAVSEQLPAAPRPRRISKPKAVTLAEAEAQAANPADKPALLKKPRAPRNKA